MIEIPKNIIIVSNRTNLLYSLTGGTGLGVLNTAGRISVGVLDLLTLPLATKSITQPVYPWEKYLDVYTSYGDMFVLDFNTDDDYVGSRIRLDTIMIFLGISIMPRVILASDLSAFCPTLGPYGSSVTSAAFSSAA
jgi:hypothetical protein